MENKNHSTIGQLKDKALDSLKGNWGIAVLVSFICSLLLYVPNMFKSVQEISNPIGRLRDTLNVQNLGIVERFANNSRITVSTPYGYVGWILNLLLAGALTYGVSRFYLKLTRDDSPKVENILDGFKQYGSTFLMNLLLMIFQFLWSLLWCIGITIVAVIFGVIFVAGGGHSVAAVVVMTLIVFATFISLAIFLNRYAMTYYIYNDDNELSVMDSIKKSVEIMNGNRVRLFLMQLSFIGWWILSVLSFFIGFLWLAPYMQATTACFYEDLIKSNEVTEEQP